MTRTLSSRTRPAETLLAAILEQCGDGRAARLAHDLGDADPLLLSHGANVAAVALSMAGRLALSPERMRVLATAGLLHDVGKRYVAREVLDKPTALVPHERHVIELHANVGATMLLEAGLVAEAAVVRHHHERWDGAGYPDRLFGPAIPLESRLIMAADAFDAMTSDRPYRSAMADAVALAEIARSAGSQLDPQCAALLADVV